MMTKEKYMTLRAIDLKELARSRGIKGAAAMKKAELVEAMLSLDEKGQEAPQAPVKRGRPRKNEAAPVKPAAEGKAPTGEEKPASRRGRPRKRKTEGAEEKKAEITAPAASAVTEVSVPEKPEDMPAAASAEEQAASEKHENVPAAASAERQAVPEKPEDMPAAASAGEQAASEKHEDVPAAASAERQAVPEKPEDMPAAASVEGQAVSEKQAVHGRQAAPDGGHSGQRTQDRASVFRGPVVRGILEVMSDGFGFLRSANFLPGEEDVYVSPSQIRRFNLKTGDMIVGNKREKAQGEKYGAILYVSSVNDFPPDAARKRTPFENMTPIFPDERIRLERPDGSRAARIIDLVSPIGRGQRGMIVSPPKAGKTTLLKDIAQSVLASDPEAHLIILLIDERPEEVTDMKESVHGKNVEIIYSTFDEYPDHHRRVAEMVIERAKRLVEHRQNVMILLDSITRLTRAYNVLVPPSGRTLSGGLDPTALYMPKRFFGAARNMREGGSLTILATALVDTGSKMDDVVYEEFKGTGNMELILDRKLQERRIFPAIDIVRSGTRREDLLLSAKEKRAVDIMHRRLNGLKPEESVEAILNAFAYYPNNEQIVNSILTKWK